MTRSNLAGMNNYRTWEAGLRALRDELRKWDMPDYVLPNKTESRNSGTVSVEVYGRDGQWHDLACSHFPDPEKNLTSIVLAIEAWRKADQRGIAGLFMEVSKLVALPSGTGPYVVLGVASGANRRDLMTAYKKKMISSHPDHGGSLEELEKIREAGRELGLA